MKTLVTLSTICLVAVQCFAQQKSVTPIKIDEFEAIRSDSQTMAAKTELFLDKLSKSPRTTHGVIIIYPQLMTTCSLLNPLKTDEETVELVSHVVAEHKGISKKRVKILKANPYLRTTTEFWFVPKGAKRPEPENREFYPNCCCPKIDIIGPAQIDITSGKISLAVQLSTDLDTDRIKYQWEASGALISSGQGTNKIEVDVSKVSMSTLKVSVRLQVRSVCNCPIFASTEIPIVK